MRLSNPDSKLVAVSECPSPKTVPAPSPASFGVPAVITRLGVAAWTLILQVPLHLLDTLRLALSLTWQALPLTAHRLPACDCSRAGRPVPEGVCLGADLVTPEGYHGGLIRTLLFGVRAQQTPLGDTVSQQILKFALLRGKLGAGNGQGLETEGTSNGEGANLVAADSATNRVSFYRAPDGVGGPCSPGRPFLPALSSLPPSPPSPPCSDALPASSPSLAAMLRAAGGHAAAMLPAACWTAAIWHI